MQLNGIGSHCTRPDPTNSSPAGKLIRRRPRPRPSDQGRIEILFDLGRQTCTVAILLCSEIVTDEAIRRDGAI